MINAKTLMLWRCGKKPVLPLITALLLGLIICQNDQLYAQGYIGIRATPNLTSIPKVFNNSPASISTGTTTALGAGLDYTFINVQNAFIFVGPVVDIGTLLNVQSRKT